MARVTVTLPLHVKCVNCAGYRQKRKMFLLDEEVLWHLTVLGRWWICGGHGSENTSHLARPPVDRALGLLRLEGRLLSESL